MSNNFLTDRSNLTPGSQIRSSERIRNLSKSDEKEQITENTNNKETKKKVTKPKETVQVNTDIGDKQDHTETTEENTIHTNNEENNTQEPEANIAETNTQHIQQKHTQNPHKMNQKEIQQNIASFVPEFSGEEQNIPNALTRFTGTADSIYETMTPAEKQIFDKLIKFRLTGNAYMRISRREATDYPGLKKILNNTYSTTVSLDELEKNYMNVQQSYGETIRSYGSRLIDEMEQYKNGFKSKYAIQDIDAAYKNHLNSTLTQNFKKGLNNIILKEKIATSRAQNIEEIITETEEIEKMLMMTTSTSPAQKQTISQQQTAQPTQSRPAAIICNFCSKPNHTWDVCRIRLNNSNTHNNPPPFQRRNHFQQNQNNFQPRYQTQTQFPQKLQPNHGQPQSMQRTNFTNTKFPQTNNFNKNTQFPQTNDFTAYRQQTQQNSYQPKYCSYCKTTKGHTFDECRSKFYGQRNPMTTNYPRPQQAMDGEKLEQKFTNMRIQPIFPYDEEHTQQPQDIFQNQENSNGSDQA